ncbi:MAG: plasmid recombination protein [Bacteroidales bacterium]|nr:plasmid recombination protein [Bacteroidales bacterium]
MERTISGMMGKGSVSHNTRTFSAKNVDKERSRYNVEFCHSDIKEVYHKLFDDALERYNAKQKRSDRKINDYYEKIRQGKQEKLFHEVIFQIGNKDDTNAKSDEGQLAKEILTEFMEDFQKRNPNLYVFSAHLHMDEETPHIHIDFVPFICNSKRGLDTRVTLKGALAEQGFKGGTRSATEWNQWIESEKQELSKVADRYGVRWKQLGTHNKHLSVLDFEKQERAKEVAELERTISSGKAELSHIIYQQVLAEEETEKIKQENEAVRQETEELSVTNDLLREQADGLLNDREKLLSNNQALEEQQKRLQKEVEKMVDSKTALERNIHTYDEDAKWQLPEPNALMSAKTYRDKHVMPLVLKLKEIVKNLTIKCVNLIDQVKQLKAKVTKQSEDIVFYKSKLHQQSFILEQLQEKADDFERVKRYVGADKIDTIVANARELERIAQNRNQHSRAYGMSR